MAHSKEKTALITTHLLTHVLSSVKHVIRMSLPGGFIVGQETHRIGPIESGERYLRIPF